MAWLGMGYVLGNLGGCRRFEGVVRVGCLVCLMLLWCVVCCVRRGVGWHVKDEQIIMEK